MNVVDVDEGSQDSDRDDDDGEDDGEDEGEYKEGESDDNEPVG